MTTTKQTKKSDKTKEVKNIYQIVTDRIVEQMSQGIIPWQKPWTYAGGKDCDLRQCAINYTTRKPYSMLNQWLLGFRPGEYLTYKQATALGGKVKKGAKCGMVVFWATTTVHDRKQRDEEGKPVVDEEGNDETVHVVTEHIMPVLKYYNVFHLDDIEGIESKYPPVEAEPETYGGDPIEAAEDIMWQYVLREEKLTFQCDKPVDNAYYQPSLDKVVVPMLSQYADPEEFYSTAFHELTHSTMPAYRCNRKDEGAVSHFGSENYAREELVAEMGSAMLCNIAGLDGKKAFKNSVAYIQGWMKSLKKNPKWIVWASSRAEKAAKYIQFGPDADAQA